MTALVFFIAAFGSAGAAGVYSKNPGITMGLICAALALRGAAEVIADAIREKN